MKRLLAASVWLTLVALLPGFIGFASATLPRAANVPGGIALIELGASASNHTAPRAWLGDKPVLVTQEQGRWIAVVGLALDLPAGRHELRVEVNDTTRHLPFTVKDKHYAEQRITLKDNSKVDLSAADTQRVQRELATLQRLKNQWTPRPDTQLDFQLPADGRHVGRFGLRRFFNGEARAPHAGFDIAVPRGTTIQSSAPGIVLAADDYFFNGKTVFVDHGNGLLSMYCHLDRIDVKVGESVSQGQRLGLSGMTGRASGPHLHWSVVLNGAMVDPQLFVPALGKGRY